MRLENLKVGKGLEVFVTREGYRYRLVSTIEAVEPGKVYITLIASGSRVFQFLPTDQVDILYRDERHILQWNNVKGSVEKYDDSKLHCLASKKEGVSFNRRKAYRVDIGEEMILRCFYEKDSQDENSNVNLGYDDYGNEIGTVKVKVFEGYIKDVSENGVGFYTNEILDIGNNIGFVLYTSFGAMYFKAEIVRHMERRSGRYMEFYGGNFTRTDKNLSKYLFARQREVLKIQRWKSK